MFRVYISNLSARKKKINFVALVLWRKDNKSFIICIHNKLAILFHFNKIDASGDYKGLSY